VIVGPHCCVSALHCRFELLEVVVAAVVVTEVEVDDVDVVVSPVPPSGTGDMV